MTEVPYGYCHCGCEQKTNLARCTDPKKGWIKGQPLRYIHRHGPRKHPRPTKPPNPSGLCQCGCGQPAPIVKRSNFALGHMAGHAVRYIAGHASRGRYRGTPEERFWAKVDKDGPIILDEDSPCWLWTGGGDQHGYGQIHIDGRAVRAHRFSYALVYGEIPDGIDICHTCDNPPCVNPDHLFAGTAKENAQDSIEKGRAVFPPNRAGIRSNAAKFTDDEIRRFRREFAQSDGNITAFARKYGVHMPTMWRILKRVMYKDVD